jgi:hypothetical protein
MRPFLFFLLAAFLAVGIGNSVIASNVMSVGMTQAAAMSASASSIDCHEDTSTAPCGGGIASCALACAFPNLDQPAAVRADQRLALIRRGVPLAFNPAVGAIPPPDLPPPRTFGIV